MSSIFGKPSQSTTTNNSTSSSGNQAYGMLSQGLAPQVSNGTGASNGLAALLGVGGDPAAQQQAFSNWKDSTGYQFGMDQGTQAITGSAAAKGLLNSGSTAKALNTFGQNYANTQYQNYLNPLQSLVQSGNQAGSTIAGAGNVSNSQSTEQTNQTGAKAGLGSLFATGGIPAGIGSLLGHI